MSPLVAWRLFIRMLRFDDPAISEIACNRWSIVYGLLASILAGWARHYDRPNLLLWLWLGPALSVGVAVFGSLLFYCSGWLAGARGTSYRAFLAVFSFTAPLGWIYAFPTELLLGEDISPYVRFCLLTVVSSWRVLILLDAYKDLMGLSPFKRVLSFLVPMGALVGIISGFQGLGTQIMAGMSGGNEERNVDLQIGLLYGIFFILVILVPTCVIARVLAWREQTRREKKRD